MTKKPQFVFRPGSGRLFLVYPFQAGYAQRVDEYVDVRAGLSWPTTVSPGYICIFGLQKVPSDKWPLVLFSEGESKNLDTLFALYASCTKKTYCPRAFAQTGENRGAGFANSLRQFRVDGDVDFPLPSDSSKFDDPDYGISLIKRWEKDQALAISDPPIVGKTILIKQLRSVKVDDATDRFEVRFYAVAALIRILGSLEEWPYRDARYETFEFANLKNRSGSKKENGYYECFTE